MGAISGTQGSIRREHMIPPIFRDAVVFASLLTMLSTGLTLTYMTTKVPNFAHGTFATVCSYVTLTFVKILGLNPYLSLVPSFLLGGLVSLGLYIFILKPLIDRGASYLVLMIATIAYEMLLLAVVNIYADFLNRTFKVLSRLFILKGYDFEILNQPGLFLIAPTAAAIMMLSMYLLLNKTRFGIAMRAAIENPPLAGVVGINVKLVYAVSWFIAGALAGIAGALTPLWLMSNPDLGSRLIVSIFAASIVGGLTNIYGAAFGGVLTGLAEVLGTGYLSTELGTWITPYRPIIPLTIMVLTLLIAPKGLAGVRWEALRKRG